MAQGTKVSAVPWMNRIGHFVFDTASSVDASLMEKPANTRVQTSISPSSGPAGSHFTCARRTLRMIASGEEKPQSAITPRTDGGSSSADNISPMHLLNVRRMAYGAREREDVTGGSAAVSLVSASTAAAPAGEEELMQAVLARVLQRMNLN